MRFRSLVAAAFLGLAALVAVPSATASAEPAALPFCKDFSTEKRTFSGETLHTNLPSTGYQNRDYDCVLKRGDRGAGVFVLQASLSACFTKIAVDGIYGQETENVVRFLQGLNGIPADGIYGPQTAKVMTWAWYNANNVHRRCAFV